MVHRGCNSSINSESTGNATFSQTPGDLLSTTEREREWIIYILWNPLFLGKSYLKEHGREITCKNGCVVKSIEYLDNFNIRMCAEQNETFVGTYQG
ncbi:hypothetical protein X777_12215 [Ooceraea biroi]|uniref:Uncharacterized protein n=1 Tax=Ooceraea biroi TaxID=2015173 RepID=A0A026W0S3_OOCBI|nr:hypothetical protein X777_12215 [Ooceraea biroi]